MNVLMNATKAQFLGTNDSHMRPVASLHTHQTPWAKSVILAFKIQELLVYLPQSVSLFVLTTILLKHQRHTITQTN